DNVSESLDRACAGCVLAERKVRPHLIIVAGVFRKNAPKMFFVEHDHVVSFARAEPIKRALPGRAKGRRSIPNAHRRVAIMATRRRTKSALSDGRRSYWPSSQWYSTITF